MCNNDDVNQTPTTLSARGRYHENAAIIMSLIISGAHALVRTYGFDTRFVA